jgi:hypothetical protein
LFFPSPTSSVHYFTENHPHHFGGHESGQGSAGALDSRKPIKKPQPNSTRYVKYHFADLGVHVILSSLHKISSQN